LLWGVASVALKYVIRALMMAKPPPSDNQIKLDEFQLFSGNA